MGHGMERSRGISELLRRWKGEGQQNVEGGPGSEGIVTKGPRTPFGPEFP